MKITATCLVTVVEDAAVNFAVMDSLAMVKGGCATYLMVVEVAECNISITLLTYTANYCCYSQGVY